MNKNENGLLKFITCGSVDDGKSTLIGHILYDSKRLYTDQKQALELDSKVGSRGGAIDYSLLLDGLMAEREQGITIDVAYRYFTTDARSFIVADTPGHEEYTRNMAVGASFADLAVILVDASQGVLVQTRRHARICALMGIRHFVFAVNKMDLMQYRQETFGAIAADIETLQKELSLHDVTVIPVSATEGDNVTKPSPHMPWYHGPILLHHLEQVHIERGNPEGGFYLPVQRVSRPNHAFRGFQGQIESGELRVGQEIIALPSTETAVVKSLLIGDRQVDVAVAGQPVTVQLDREVDVSRGCVLTTDPEIKAAKAFSASLLWMDDKPLSLGQEYWIKIGTKMLPCVLEAAEYIIDVNSGEHLPVQAVSKNELTRCRVKLLQETVLDRFAAHKTLGELILIDRISHATAACGVVESVDTEGEQGAVFEDGTQSISLPLFDGFYYHKDLQTIVRHSAPKAVYWVGEPLPLRSECCRYPDDFDVLAGGAVVQIRHGKFAGIGSRTEGEQSFPLLDGQGFALDQGTLLPFETYRRIGFWEESSKA